MAKVLGFEFDKDNIAHIAAHGITSRQLWEILYRNEYIVRHNRPNKAGTHLLIGLDGKGTCISVALIRARQFVGLWRPVTAFPSSPQDEITLRESLSKRRQR